jgi:PAS domain S-box-containing protein
MSDVLRILHLEDRPDDSEIVKMILTNAGIRCEILRVETRQQFISELENENYDMVLADYSLPSFDGMTALALTNEKRPGIPFILISGTVGEELAVEALKAGGTDYILKERLSRLPFAVERALSEAQDRTAHKQAQENLIKLSSAVEQSADSVVITDRNGVFQYVNPAFEKLTGYKKEEVEGKTPRILKSGEHPEVFYKDLWQTILSGKVFRAQFTNKKKNGEFYYEELTITPIRDENGTITHFVSTGKDITQNKIAERALVASERRYRLLFERNPLPMWVYDLQTLAFLDVNESAVHHYGYSKEEFLSMTIRDIRPAEDIPALMKNIESTSEIIQESGPWRHRKKNGEIIFVEALSHMLDFGQREARLVLAHDITDRRQAELKMQEAEKKFRGIFENSVEGIFQSTPEGKIITANDATARIYGYDSAEELLVDISDAAHQIFVDPKLREGLKKDLEERGAVNGFEFEAFKKDGNKIWITENVRLVRDQSGKPLYYEGFLKDITERKEAQRAIHVMRSVLIVVMIGFLFILTGELSKGLMQPYMGSRLSSVLVTAYLSFVLAVAVFFALRKQQKLYRQKLEEITERRRTEEELRRSEERFKQIADSISEVFWMSDPQLQKALYVSPAYEKIWGRSCQSLYDEPNTFAESLHPEDREKFNEHLRAFVTDGIFDVEFRIMRPDGSIRWIWDRGFPIRNDKGEVVRVAGIAQDITERKIAEEQTKQLEKQLIQVQKIEAIGRLAGGVAHDFNNILMAVQGYSELLLLKSNEESQRAEIMEIMKAAHQGTNLTQQLLAFSRRQILTKKVIDLKALIFNMKNMVQRLIGEDVDLTTHFVDNLRKIEADPGQIQQVIMNLAINARDAMPKGGKLSIEAENIDLDENFAGTHVEVKPGPYILLSVLDSGTGMNDATMAKIFEPFFTTKQEGKGTGLGLATVYGIVKQSGGYIFVESQPGKGTAFKIYFPHSDRTEESHSDGTKNQQVQKHDVKGATILLADDNREVRTAISTYLEMKGYRVLQADRGSQAIQIAKTIETPIELLISDVVMPEMSGSELAKELTTIYPHLKVLLMSGYTDEVMKKQDGVAFLSKPVSMEILLRKISDLLHSSLES